MSAPRFVHAVTILAHQSNNFSDSDNWKLLCVKIVGGSTVCGSYVGNNDKFGKEMPIGEMLSELKIESNDAMTFFWIGLFTTSKDCTGDGLNKYVWS